MDATLLRKSPENRAHGKIENPRVGGSNPPPGTIYLNGIVE
jgi:hypothetical protein